MCEQINIMAALAEAMGCLIRHNFGAASTTHAIVTSRIRLIATLLSAAK